MPGKKKNADPKKQIIEAATRLFAKQCYAGTGMRELAQEAGVNLATINYHFGSKHKVLEAIIGDFFERLSQIASSNLCVDCHPEEKLRGFIREAIELFRNNPELVIITFSELPYDIPAIAEFKSTCVVNLQAIFKDTLEPALTEALDRSFRMEILGPALATLMASHFFFKSVIEKKKLADLNDAFYDEYADEITRLFLHGLFGCPQGE